MGQDEVIHDLYDSILSLDRARARALAEEAIGSAFDLSQIVEKGMSAAMEEVGARFQSGDMFLPELQLAADAFQEAMEILQPRLLETGGEVRNRGKVLVGTVKGDVHSIGKNLVAIMLKTAGFEVVDLGADVPTFTFVEQAQKHRVEVIALSALMTNTMPRQGEVIEALDGLHLRERFAVIVGGGPVNQEWADRIGADGYGRTAVDAVALARKLCGAKVG